MHLKQDLFVTELVYSLCINLCLGFGWFCLLSRPLLGFQHLGLDLKIIFHNQYLRQTNLLL